MSGSHSIPEVRALDGSTEVLRIPNEQQVPLTNRVRRLVDTAPFQRLRNIKQLGLVSLVYPGATHSRFEHSLGAYRMALLFLRQLSRDDEFATIVTTEDAQRFVVAALLHDLGHWPFCHPIEDLGLETIQSHESRCLEIVQASEIATLLETDWELDAEQAIKLIQGHASTQSERILSSMFSGPIDFDKMDYLQRDSLHAGVPYGQHFDPQRLIASLCLNQAHDRLAITDKGRTAAELMVFARYVMFSEVYWHHAVRSATAMLQRAFYETHEQLHLHELYQTTDSEWTESVIEVANQHQTKGVSSLWNGLFGPQRRLYKRVGQFASFENETIYRRLARQPYPWLAVCSRELAQIIEAETGQPTHGTQVLIDAPPVGLEVQFDIDVRTGNGSFRKLGDMSPVVKALATHQFDDFVKRIRVFIDPEHTRIKQARDNLSVWLERAIEQTSTASTQEIPR